MNRFTAVFRRTSEGLEPVLVCVFVTDVRGGDSFLYPPVPT